MHAVDGDKHGRAAWAQPQRRPQAAVLRRDKVVLRVALACAARAPAVATAGGLVGSLLSPRQPAQAACPLASEQCLRTPWLHQALT